MDLTLQSATSPGALVGHLAQILLIASMMLRSMALLRALVIASAIVSIAYHAIWLSDPVGVFWKTILVLVNIVQLVWLWREDRAARFSREDRKLIDERLPPLSPGTARRFLDTGDWVDLAPGETLTREGEWPEALHFLAAGQADVLQGGARVAGCGPGSFVGEMALLHEDATAAATVTMAEAGRAWRIGYDKLERMELSQPQAWAALNTAISRDMRGKIVAQNAARAGD